MTYDVHWCFPTTFFHEGLRFWQKDLIKNPKIGSQLTKEPATCYRGLKKTNVAECACVRAQLSCQNGVELVQNPLSHYILYVKMKTSLIAWQNDFLEAESFRRRTFTAISIFFVNMYRRTSLCITWKQLRVIILLEVSIQMYNAPICFKQRAKISYIMKKVSSGSENRPSMILFFWCTSLVTSHDYLKQS